MQGQPDFFDIAKKMQPPCQLGRDAAETHGGRRSGHRRWVLGREPDIERGLKPELVSESSKKQDQESEG